MLLNYSLFLRTVITIKNYDIYSVVKSMNFIIGCIIWFVILKLLHYGFIYDMIKYLQNNLLSRNKWLLYLILLE